MEVEQYLNPWKVLHNHLLDFIDNQDDSQGNYQKLISDINNQRITENKDYFQCFLHLLVLISINHHRYSNFFIKIDQILTFLAPKIVQTFSNTEIFNIFYKNKRVVLFLIKNDIFKYDEKIMKSKVNDKYFEYFVESDENHSKAKEKGENDSYICQLIREDSIEEFIVYVNKTNTLLTRKIEPSIYETNSLMMHKQLELIDYASFFGSIKIVKYLLNNKVKFTELSWICGIHSNNSEIIQLFEDNKFLPKNDLISQKYLEESIKCHHNDIATYIQDNYIQNDNIYMKNITAYCFHYYNYSKLSECEKNNDFFIYACKYDNNEIVKLLMNDDKIDINYKIANKIFKL